MLFLEHTLCAQLGALAELSVWGRSHSSIPASEESTLTGTTLWPGWARVGERLTALKAYGPLIVLGRLEGSPAFLILLPNLPAGLGDATLFGNEFR